MPPLHRALHELDFDGLDSGQPSPGWLCLLSLPAVGLCCLLSWIMASIRLGMMPRQPDDREI